MLDVQWWGYGLIALAMTHLTIVSVTIYLHRHQTHRALDLHPSVSHFFRFWLWLTTGMVTRDWVSVHRKHHATTETAEDPHSPQFLGIARLLWGGVLLYAAETRNRDTIAKYGHGTPNDWIETNLYGRFPMGGIVLIGFIDIAAFGIGPGSLIYGVQMAWIPFWAAGVINGLGHYWGYRNYAVEDASTNLFPLGILIGGEEFHNNHHAYPTSAKLSSMWYEFDVGWMYIRILDALGLASVRRTAPTPAFSLHKTHCDADTVRAIITHRHYILAQYTGLVRDTCRQQIARVRRNATAGGRAFDAPSIRNVRRWLRLYTWDRQERRPMMLDAAVREDRLLQMVYSMRQELSELSSPSTASTDQLLVQLGDWQARADASGIGALREFARRLPQLV
ncbi:MAG: fatty acid desaturase [Betaproteobacteria bacterium]